MRLVGPITDEKEENVILIPKLPSHLYGIVQALLGTHVASVQNHKLLVVNIVDLAEGVVPLQWADELCIYSVR